MLCGILVTDAVTSGAPCRDRLSAADAEAAWGRAVAAVERVRGVRWPGLYYRLRILSAMLAMLSFQATPQPPLPPPLQTSPPPYTNRARTVWRVSPRRPSRPSWRLWVRRRSFGCSGAGAARSLVSKDLVVVCMCVWGGGGGYVARAQRKRSNIITRKPTQLRRRKTSAPVATCSLVTPGAGDEGVPVVKRYDHP